MSERYCGICDALRDELLCPACGAATEDRAAIVGMVVVADGGTSGWTVKCEKEAREHCLVLSLADIRPRQTYMMVGVHLPPEQMNKNYGGALGHLLLARKYAQKGVREGTGAERQRCLKMDAIVTRALRRVGLFSYDEAMVEDQRGEATEHAEGGAGGDEGGE